MSNTISDAVGKLSIITKKTPIDWCAFDSVLKNLENINGYDDQNEETILSEFMLEGDFYKRGMVLPDVVRHFLSCGYDVSANDGLNGGLALNSLCWASYDPYILDAAKMLMNAGAPVCYRTSDDDPGDEPKGLLGAISFKISGAWELDEDAEFANILEAYYAMTEANIAGRDYNSIENYSACLGKPLTSVYVIGVNGKTALQEEGEDWIYSEPLVLWFEDKPLVASCYVVADLRQGAGEFHGPLQGGSQPRQRLHLRVEIVEIHGAFLAHLDEPGILHDPQMVRHGRTRKVGFCGDLTHAHPSFVDRFKPYIDFSS